MIRVEFTRDYKSEDTPTETKIYPLGWRGSVPKKLADDAIDGGYAVSIETAVKTEKKSSNENKASSGFKHKISGEDMAKLESYLQDIRTKDEAAKQPTVKEISKAIDVKIYAEHSDFVWKKLTTPVE